MKPFLKIFVVLLLVFSMTQAQEFKKIPGWYYRIKNLSVQKKVFFAILKPLVEKENERILQERAFVISYFKAKNSQMPIANTDREKLNQIAKKYRIKNLDNEEEYLFKIDKIPLSLVLAQAALESGWGKSRFARIANNLFGEWTYGKKGIVPKYRPSGKHHKIRIFDSISDSIASYMLNLNRNKAYKEFRYARFMARKSGHKFHGLEAAMTMHRYSSIGRQYTRLVANIIKKNRLHID